MPADALGVELSLATDGAVGMTTDVPPQGATVEVGEVLDVVEVQAVAGHQRLDGRTREVAVVLVVDGVELDMLDEVADVGVLDGQHAVVGEQGGESADEVVEVGHVGHHVVGHDHVGRDRAQSRMACA